MFSSGHIFLGKILSLYFPVDIHFSMLSFRTFASVISVVIQDVSRMELFKDLISDLFVFVGKIFDDAIFFKDDIFV